MRGMEKPDYVKIEALEFELGYGQLIDAMDCTEDVETFVNLLADFRKRPGWTYG